jgi:hypothetical protein
MIFQTLIRILTAASLVMGPSMSNTALAQYPADQAQAADFVIDFFPVAPYHVGDILSARVTYSGSDEIKGHEIRVALADEPNQTLATVTFSGANQQAVFYWFYNTQESASGWLAFTFTIPGLDTWTAGVHLLPDPGNRQAAWSTVHSPCCTIHYLTGTDAEVDLLGITETLEARSDRALSQFASAGVIGDRSKQKPLSIALVPIVIGHGGYATNEAVLTYSHRNWAGIDFGILTHHELVHVIDRRINPDGPRPSIFAEGIAVYLSGGHYREGDHLQRAAALLALDLYLPLGEIVDNFYAAQHEIGYMGAAALVAYLDLLWGWETLIDFYFNLPEGPSDAQIISSGLEARFGMDLAELEADFISHLSSLAVDPQVEADVRLTVETYDMLRRYQTLLIPSAHFRTPWWPPIDQMREAGMVGDYAYREKAPLNIILESYFLKIHAALDRQDYPTADTALGKINEILTIVENSGGTPSHYSIGWPLIAHPGRLTPP